MKCVRCEKEFLPEFLNVRQTPWLSDLDSQQLPYAPLNYECHNVGLVIPN